MVAFLPWDGYKAFSGFELSPLSTGQPSTKIRTSFSPRPDPVQAAARRGIGAQVQCAEIWRREIYAQVIACAFRARARPRGNLGARGGCVEQTRLGAHAGNRARFHRELEPFSDVASWVATVQYKCHQNWVASVGDRHTICH